jgi:hypothetical protein
VAICTWSVPGKPGHKLYLIEIKGIKFWHDSRFIPFENLCQVVNLASFNPTRN